MNCIFCQEPTNMTYFRLYRSGQTNITYDICKQCFQNESGFNGTITVDECFLCRIPLLDLETDACLFRNGDHAWFLHKKCFVDLVGEDWLQDNKE